MAEAYFEGYMPALNAMASGFGGASPATSIER